eukprot:Pgem_evm1s11344
MKIATDSLQILLKKNNTYQLIPALEPVPVKNLKMEKFEDGIESRRVFFSTKTSRL